MWHVTWTLCLGASCSKAPEGEECQSSLVHFQSFQLRIFRQLWWHPTGTSSDFFSENNWDTASLTSSPWRRYRELLPSQCMLPTCEGTAQGKSPHDLGCPPLSGQRSKPCFQWRQYLAPPHYQVVHLDTTSQYLGEKHEWWPIYRWDRGTCLFTRWRHGLSVNGGCQRLQPALPPHLALLAAGCSDWWPPGIGPPCTSRKERWLDIVKKSDCMTSVTRPRTAFWFH